MRVLIASDLHYGVSRDGTTSIRILADHVVRHGADVLVLVGDLATGPETLSACLQLFEDFEGIKLAVPGNHDIWLSGWSETSSMIIHENRLPDLFFKHGFHPLHIEPRVIDGVAFVGSMGWYDYSFRDEIGIALHHYQKKSFPGTPRASWGDALFARWSLSDMELCDMLNARLAHHLMQVGTTPSVLAFVHHLVHRDLRPTHHFRWAIPTVWRFLNAFLGADCFGETLLKDERVKQVFCGHVHRAKTLPRNGVRLTTIGGDYKRKQLIETSLTKIHSRRLFYPDRPTTSSLLTDNSEPSP